MPLLLYRYILHDLLRVILLTTTVLVTVIAFGAAIRPLAEGQLFGPFQVAKYIGLVIVPMLQFALPFSAGFAATLSMHRMACDNEMVAIAVGGISYQKIFLPAVGLGLVLFALMVGLTQWVIPIFWGQIEKTITRDVTDLFQSRIENGQPFVIDNWQIYADELVIQANPPDTGAQTRLILLGVAAAELDDENKVVMDFTASRAAIDIHRRNEQTILKLVLTDTVTYDNESGEFSSPRMQPPAMVIKSLMGSEVKTMTRGQMLALRDDPEGYASIIYRKVDLANALFDYEVWAGLDERLAAHGAVTMTDNVVPGQTFEVRADGIEQGMFFRNDEAPITITRRNEGETTRRFISSNVEMISSQADSTAPATFTLRLIEYEIQDIEHGGSSNFRKQIDLSDLSLESFQPVNLTRRPVAEVLQIAHALEKPDLEVGRILRNLENRLTTLQWEVSARLLKRYALSGTALLLIVLGSVLAVWLKAGQPLTIYMLAFLPAIGDLMLISGGEQMMRDGWLGLGVIVMWSGNALLVAISLFVFIRLKRN